MMILLNKIKYYLAAAGTALIGVAALVLRLRALETQRDKAKKERDSIKATLEAEQKGKQAKKQAEKDLIKKQEEIKEEVKKEGEDFKGLDNLSNPNDW